MKELFDSWSQLERSKKGGQHVQDKIKWTADEIKASIKTMEWDIQDLEDTVRIVEANPAKFRLDQAEIKRRNQFINDTKSTMNVWISYLILLFSIS